MGGRYKLPYRIDPNRSTVRECKGLGARLLISIIKPVIRYQSYTCIPINRIHVDPCLQGSGDLRMCNSQTDRKYCSNFSASWQSFDVLSGVNLMWYVCCWRGLYVDQENKTVLGLLCLFYMTDWYASIPFGIPHPECVWVEVSLENPLRIPLVLTDVLLLWEFVGVEYSSTGQEQEQETSRPVHNNESVDDVKVRSTCLHKNRLSTQTRTIYCIDRHSYTCLQQQGYQSN